MGCMAANAQEGSANGKWAIETEIIPNFTAQDWFVPNLTLGYTLNNGNQVYASVEVNTNRYKNNPNSPLATPLRSSFATDAAFDAAMEDFNHAMDEYDKGAYGDFTLGLGYQYYFVKEGHFRPFINAGIDLVFAWANMRNHMENYDPVNDAWYTNDITTKGLFTDGVNTYSKGFGLELDLGLGFDYFIYQGIYIGAELGLSYDMFWANNIKVHGVTTNTAIPEDLRDVTTTYEVKDFTSEGYQ